MVCCAFPSLRASVNLISADYVSRDVRQIIIKLGKVEKSNGVRGKHEQQFTAIKVVCHPYSNCKTENQPRLNDIALVKLSRYGQNINTWVILFKRPHI